MNSTLRQWLTNANFDWKNGTIIYHETKENDSPGWSFDIISRQSIGTIHPILDLQFYDGYGSPQAPKIFARDNDAIYFPMQYDGATWLEKVIIDPEYYLNDNANTPYPGG